MACFVRKMTSFILLLLVMSAKAQTSLTVGDKFDRNIISAAVNYFKDSLNLSEFKGKNLLIDFWAPWCTPCIGEFKKLDSLQLIYKNDLQIVLVTYEPTAKIKEFFEKSEIGKRTKMPSIVNDRKLHNMFKHVGIPHEVWINTNDSVVAITSHVEVTGANIEKLIKNKKFNTRTKKDVFNYNYSKPFLLNGNGTNGMEQRIISNSILTGYVEGLNSMIYPKKDSLGLHYGISAINIDLLKLLIVAYGKFKYRPSTKTRVFVEVKDSSMFLPQNIKSDDVFEWVREKGICYDQTLPIHTKDEDDVYNLMQQDLRRAFPQYYGKIEKRNIDCWALIRTSSQDKIKSKGGSKKIAIVTSGKHEVINAPLSDFIDILNAFAPLGFPYMADQTNYSGNIDIELGEAILLNQKAINIDELNKQLKKYDLSFVRKNVELDALIIRQD